MSASNERRRPYTTGSVAMSLDGYIDDESPTPLILSSQEDFVRIDRLRAEQDAILVGAGTLRADNPKLVLRSPALREERVRKGLPPDPLKVTITERGGLDPQLHFFQIGASEKLVYCPEKLVHELTGALGAAAVVVACPDDRVAQFVVEDLFKRGVRTLLIEGGQRVHSLFLQAGLVDELRVAIAPFLVGDGKAPRFVGPGRYPFTKDNRLVLSGVEQLDDTAVLHYRSSGNGSKESL